MWLKTLVGIIAMIGGAYLAAMCAVTVLTLGLTVLFKIIIWLVQFICAFLLLGFAIFMLNKEKK